MNIQLDPISGDPMPQTNRHIMDTNQQSSVVASTDDDLRQECKEGLVLLVRNNKGTMAALAAIRELLNRIDGTPAQTVKLDATVKGCMEHIIITTEESDRIWLKAEQDFDRNAMIDTTPLPSQP